MNVALTVSSREQTLLSYRLCTMLIFSIDEIRYVKIIALNRRLYFGILFGHSIEMNIFTIHYNTYNINRQGMHGSKCSNK